MKLPPMSRSPLVSLIYSDLLQFSQVIKATRFVFPCLGMQTCRRAPCEEDLHLLPPCLLLCSSSSSGHFPASPSPITPNLMP